MHHTCIMQIVRFSDGSGEGEEGEERREEKEAMKEGGGRGSWKIGIFLSQYTNRANQKSFLKDEQ